MLSDAEIIDTAKGLAQLRWQGGASHPLLSDDVLAVMRAFGTSEQWRGWFKKWPRLWRPLYLAYLKSAAWNRKRQAVLEAKGERCEVCMGRATQIHHRSYARIGDEAIEDLEPLCPGCHSRKHGKPA